MRRLLIVLALLVVAAAASTTRAANAVSISQSGGAAGSGVCASTQSAAYFNTAGNWSLTPTDIQIGPDTTVTLCGSITSTLVMQGSGTSGHPVIIFWGPGAVLSQPVCPSVGCFQGNGKTDFTLDGGGTGDNWTLTFTTNGTIQSTANGSALANHVQASEVINIDNTNRVTIKNLAIINAYVRTSISDLVPSQPDPTAIHAQGASNLTIHNNLIHDALWAVYFGLTSSNITVDHNDIYNSDHDIVPSVTTQTLDTVFIHHNRMHDWANWDSAVSDNKYHHDGVHNFQFGGGTFSNIYIHHNYFYGDSGANTTAQIFNEGSTAATSVFVWDNVFTNVANRAWSNGSLCLTIGDPGTMKAWNNTITNVSGLNVGVNQPLAVIQGTNDDFRNNVISLTANGTAGGAPGVNKYGANTPTFIPNGLSNNFYGINPTTGQYFFPFTNTFDTFSQWRVTFAAASGQELNSMVDLPTNFAINTVTGVPGAGSTLLNKGINLSPLCTGNFTSLCTDFNDNPRPSTGNWDPGAYQVSGGVITPPNAPTGLTASVAGSTVNLNWSASAGSPTPTGYTEYRGTVHNGPYSIIKTGITTTSTTDTPANGSYFYTMTAFVGGLISSISGNGATAIVTCSAVCQSFPTGTTFTIFGNTIGQYNGTFTSTGQPTSTTFTFASTTAGPGTGGAAWPTNQESVKSNEATATVPAALTGTLLPASRTFAAQNVGTTSASQSFTYTNTSGPGGTTSITSISYTGANLSDFGQTNNCPSLLLSGLSCTINATFTPTAAGSRVATLTIVTSATGSPFTAAVSGTGVSLAPGVNLNPTSLNFGDQTLSTTSTVRSIILTNTGSGTLNITSVVASGDFAVVTVPVTNCGGTLASLATCSLNVTFTPTATGGRTGAVTVTDNAAGNPHVATLSGNGITTKCQMSGNVTLSGLAGVCQ